jgi:hypothetical protein
MADANNQEAGKAPVKETSDFAQSIQPGGTQPEGAKVIKPEPENQRSVEGRTPQAGR